MDFEHERREEVIQWIYETYGRHRAGIAATVIRYRPRSAIRGIGKALGLTEDVTARLASTQWGSWGTDIGDNHVRQAGLDPKNPTIARAVGFAIRLLGSHAQLSVCWQHGKYARNAHLGSRYACPGHAKWCFSVKFTCHIAYFAQ